LEAALTDRTRVVATVHASNAVGTVNPVGRIAEMAHAVGAYHVVDAVQSAPHVPLDVQAIGCDFLLCSAYKFFGPHLGVMYGRADLLESLPVYKVRPAKDAAPYRWETGTLAFESIAALGAALEYLAQIGRANIDSCAAAFPGFAGERLEFKCAMETIRQYEAGLVTRLLEVLARMPDVKVYGITDIERLEERCPTVVFTHGRYTADEIADYLAVQHVYVWSGHYYAVEIMDRLGHPEDGMLRVGLSHYNTAAEVDRFGDVLSGFLGGA
ncbi:MAG: aminotransferase class V-fold PLP-dependent enzyme, partial [Chloroflexota bacterium]